MELIKVVIVDDEEIIREGLNQAIPWQSLGFTVVGTACNGKEGLEIIKSLQPDLVITDVKMPIMDGLELSGMINDSYPDINIIILSGYDDFQYAQKALKSGVIEYILKPVYKPDFMEILKSVREKVLSDKSKKKHIDELTFKANAGEYLVRDRLILDYLTLADRDAEKLKENLIYFGGNPYFCFPTVAVTEVHTVQNSNTDQTKLKTNIELRRVLEELFTDKGIVFQNKDGSVGIIFSWDQHNMLEKINELSVKLLQVKVTTGVGNPYNNLSDIYKSYNEARQSIQGKFYKNTGSIVCFREIEKYKKAYTYPKNREDELYNSIKASSVDSLEQGIDGFFNDILMNGPIEINVIYDAILRLLISIEKRTLSEAANEGAQNDLILFSYEDIVRLETINEAKEFICNYLVEISNYLSRKDVGTNSSIIKKALAVMEQECANCTLSSVAENVYVTPSYLSLLFKLETGDNFIDLLTNIRIEKAKKLLSNTQLKNYDVGEKVGYPDQRYFSQIFKKVTGMSPREYREKCGQ